MEAAEELVQDGCDLVVPEGRKEEAGGTAGVGDREPAVDQLSSEFGGGLVGIGYLGQFGRAVVRHVKERASWV